MMLRSLFHSISLALVLWIATASPASAQTFRDTIAPALRRDDYEFIVGRLELTEPQRAAANRLYDGYVAEHERNVKVFKQAWKDHEKSVKWVEGERITDPAADEALTTSIKRYHDQKPGLQKSFLKDLRELLNTSQGDAHWPRAERFVRRQLMNEVSFRGAVEWQRPDLLRGLHPLALPADAQAKVQPILDEYELLIDKQLVRMEPLRGKPEDEATTNTWTQAVIELRAINRRTLRLLMQELPPDHAETLNRWARKLAYWHMQGWDRTIIHEATDGAKKLASISPEQLARIDALVLEMGKRTAEVRRLAEAELDEADAKMMAMSDRDAKLAATNGTHPGFEVDRHRGQEFSDLYEAWMAQLEAMLTPDQRKELWPPTGSFRQWAIDRSRKVFEP